MQPIRGARGVHSAIKGTLPEIAFREEIGLLCGMIHEVNAQAIVIVDNSYGEFVDEREPPDAGADLVAGR